MRSIPEVMDDPQALPAELELLANQDPRTVIMHPNCPSELWWKWAWFYPDIAQSSPLSPLFALEDPARYESLWDSDGLDWILADLTALSPHKKRQSFLNDCVAHVLPYYEAACHGDMRMRDAVEWRRQCIWRDSLHAELDDVFSLVSQAERELTAKTNQYITEQIPAWCPWPMPLAARSVINSFRQGTDRDALRQAAEAAGQGALALRGESGDMMADFYFQEKQAKAEYGWQWNRLLQYLRGEE